jgi:hypothetical protein
LFDSAYFFADGQYECSGIYEGCRADPAEQLPKLPPAGLIIDAEG